VQFSHLQFLQVQLEQSPCLQDSQSHVHFDITFSPLASSQFLKLVNLRMDSTFSGRSLCFVLAKSSASSSLMLSIAFLIFGLLQMPVSSPVFLQ